MQIPQAEYLRKLEFSKGAIDINEALITYFFFDGEEANTRITVDLLIRKGYLIGENKSPWGTPYKILFDQKSGIVVETEDYLKRKVVY